jgi:cytochrome P450
VAGTDTTGAVIGVGLYHILSNDTIRERLHKEVLSVWAEEERHPSLQGLEALPYLRACVSESLRYSSPFSGRLPRIVPESGLEVDGCYLPPGTQVSMSIYVVHFDENVFKDPFTFDPARWLNGASEQFLIPFSTGSRACMGLNLALAEIYISLATVARSYRATNVLTEYEWRSTLVSCFPKGLNVSRAKTTA